MRYVGFFLAQYIPIKVAVIYILWLTEKEKKETHFVWSIMQQFPIWLLPIPLGIIWSWRWIKNLDQYHLSFL